MFPAARYMCGTAIADVWSFVEMLSVVIMARVVARTEFTTGALALGAAEVCEPSKHRRDVIVSVESHRANRAVFKAGQAGSRPQ